MPRKRKRAEKKKDPLTNVRNRPLRDVTAEALRRYFKDLNGHNPGDLYGLVLGEVEAPLFETVMEHTHGNQSRAAEILGINTGHAAQETQDIHSAGLSGAPHRTVLSALFPGLLACLHTPGH